MQKDIIIIHTDGGSRGNPGPAACAFVAELNGKTLHKDSKFLGITTNNVAEYWGVKIAMDWLLKNKNNYLSHTVLFILDSELIVKQLAGIYKTKKPELQLLSLDIKKMINIFERKIFFKHVLRGENKIADQLLNQELDKH